MTEISESTVAIRKKLAHIHLVSFTLGVVLVWLGSAEDGVRWNLVLGGVASAFALLQLVAWQFRPSLIIAPWGISRRRHPLGDLRRVPREEVAGWSESSFELLLWFKDGETIKVALEEYRASEIKRLAAALRELGYESMSAAYQSE